MEVFIDRAIELSMMQTEGGPFGAVVVHNHKIVGEGWNQVTGLNDPTAHAEIQAIRSACKNLETFDLSGCEIYTSCKPCPMCAAAILWARLRKVYYVCTTEDATAAGFDDKRFAETICVVEKQYIQVVEKHCEGVEAMKKWLGTPNRVEY